MTHIVAAGVSGVWDWGLKKFCGPKGLAWSLIGDFHDDLYARGCPRALADPAYKRMMRGFGMSGMGAVSGWLLVHVGPYVNKGPALTFERWTREKVDCLDVIWARRIECKTGLSWRES